LVPAQEGGEGPVGRRPFPLPPAQQAAGQPGRPGPELAPGDRGQADAAGRVTEAEEVPRLARPAHRRLGFVGLQAALGQPAPDEAFEPGQILEWGRGSNGARTNVYGTGRDLIRWRI
jgi:hypothetical protein